MALLLCVPPGADAGGPERGAAAPVAAARAAQPAWGARPVARRLRVVRRLRRRLAADAAALAAVAGRPGDAGLAETLTAEVLPLADACRFLERRAEALLAPRRPGAEGRPGWLAGVELEIRREPLGVVLVIAPGNYPLFLPGVQALQALVAGNAVVLKPGRGGTAAADRLARLAVGAGLDPRLLAVLPEEPEAARGAIAAGVDKVLLTGSAATGRQVLAELAPRLVPAAMELSGCDAAFVRADADVELAARALAFGLRLNGGATCIAPRRVFVHRSLAPVLERRLGELAAALPARPVSPAAARRAVELAAAEVARGARLVAGRLDPGALGGPFPPLVVAAVGPASPLLAEDLFAPVLALVAVDDDEAALTAAGGCPYALGATVFGRDEAAARRLALRVRAGVVVINDAIVPTADPRLPFGGRGDSGFGVTRGADGLLALTAVKAVALRAGGRLDHLQPPRAGDAALFAAWIELVHGGWRRRLGALGRLLAALGRRRRAGGGADRAGETGAASSLSLTDEPSVDLTTGDPR